MIDPVEARDPAPLALFDFDGTLTNQDTTWALGVYLASEVSRRRTAIVRLAWLFALLKARILSNQDFKKRFAELLLRGLSERAVTALAEQFFDCYVDRCANRQMLNLLKGHRRRGHAIYLVSANFDFVLDVVSRRWRLDGSIGTQTERVDGEFTGRLTGPACHGSEKLRQATAVFGSDRIAAAYAYGDTRSDAPLLRGVGFGYWVRLRGDAQAIIIPATRSQSRPTACIH
jgi:HAD superfamily hydrolase (TIGR01490 family)